MNTEKIAIHIPAPELSRAVQERLFKMGYGWEPPHSTTALEKVFKEYELLSCISIYKRHGEEYVGSQSLTWYKSQGYTILTVDEFFKREAEKAKEVLWGSEKITGNQTGFIVPISTEILDKCIANVLIPWDKYDEIGKLRPKEGV